MKLTAASVMVSCSATVSSSMESKYPEILLICYPEFQYKLSILTSGFFFSFLECLALLKLWCGVNCGLGHGVGSIAVSSSMESNNPVISLISGVLKQSPLGNVSSFFWLFPKKFGSFKIVVWN